MKINYGNAPTLSTQSSLQSKMESVKWFFFLLFYSLLFDCSFYFTSFDVAMCNTVFIANIVTNVWFLACELKEMNCDIIWCLHLKCCTRVSMPQINCWIWILAPGQEVNSWNILNHLGLVVVIVVSAPTFFDHANGEAVRWHFIVCYCFSFIGVVASSRCSAVGFSSMHHILQWIWAPAYQCGLSCIRGNSVLGCHRQQK